MKYNLRKFNSLFVILLMIILFFPKFSRGQDSDFNLKKYWYLRWRLKNYFMVVGGERGMSVPAATRGQNSTEIDPFLLQNGDWGGPSLGFGDDLLYLGSYIGVLATEFKLLVNNNQNTDETLRELYYALKAVERYDNFESRWPSDKEPGNLLNNLDGLLSRWDPPHNFIELYNGELNRTLTSFDPVSNLGDPQKIELNSYPNKKENSPKLFSIDHISGLFTGFALVTKCVPYSVTYNGMEIRKEVEAITTRIIDYLQDNQYEIKFPDGSPQYKTLEEKLNNNTGFIGAPVAYGIAKAAAYIVPEKKDEFIEAFEKSMKGTWDLGGMALLGLGDFMSVFFPNSDYLAANVTSNSALLMAYGAIGNSWETVAAEMLASNPYTSYATVLGLGCFIPGVECTQGILWRHSKHLDWEAYYPLLHGVLYDYGTLTDQSEIEEDLNKMPCSGHYNIVVNGVHHVSTDWGTSTKYRSSPAANETGNENEGNQGIYSGLDYMLVFNMYCLHEDGGYVANYKKVFHNDYLTLSGTVPYVEKGLNVSPYLVAYGAGNPTAYTTAEPIDVNILGTLTSGQIIDNRDISGNYSFTIPGIRPHEVRNITIAIPYPTMVQAKVSYKASNIIYLTPPFHVGPGVDFHAEVGPLTCNTQGTGYRAPVVVSNDNGEITEKTIKNNPALNQTENKTKTISYSKNTGNENIKSGFGLIDNFSTVPSEKFMISPNPATGQFDVNYFSSSTKGGIKIQIMDITGRIIFDNNYASPINQEFLIPIDIASFKPGLYSLKLSDNNSGKTARIIIQ